MQEFTNQPLLKKKKNCSKFPLADKQKQVFFYEFSSGHEGGGRGEEEEEEKKKTTKNPHITMWQRPESSSTLTLP